VESLRGKRKKNLEGRREGGREGGSEGRWIEEWNITKNQKWERRGKKTKRGERKEKKRSTNKQLFKPLNQPAGHCMCE